MVLCISMRTGRVRAAPLCCYCSSNRSCTLDDWYQPLRHLTLHYVIIHQPKDSIRHVTVSREQNDRQARKPLPMWHATASASMPSCLCSSRTTATDVSSETFMAM